MSLLSKIRKNIFLIIGGVLLVFNAILLTTTNVEAKEVSDQNYRMHMSGSNECPSGTYWVSCTNYGNECSYYSGGCFNY